MGKNEAVIRLNGNTARTSPVWLSHYICDLANRGYKIHIRYVSLLDFVPDFPLVSRFIRLALFRTGLWKKQLWLELRINKPAKG